MSDEFQKYYEQVWEAAKASKMKIRIVDCICENDAAFLLGYSSGDTLRMQGAKVLPYTRVGNRRFYSLADIARLWSKKIPY